MKKLSVLLLALLLVFAFASCGVLELPANTDAAQAALDAAFSETKLEVTEDFTLDKKLVDEFGHTYEIVWTSSNEAVATVVDGADKVTVKVTPSYFENVVVKLTGTITEGDVTASVTLTYTVPQNKVCVHDYKVIKTLAATCCDDGYEAYECNNCGRQYMVTLFATEEHDFKAIETVAPTCTEKGYTVYECTVGGTQKTDDFVDALGHEWEFVEHVDAEAFTTHGYDLYICTVCEAEKLENVVHVYDYEATQYTTLPTCTEDGERAMFCYVCLLDGVQEYEWQTIPATGVHVDTDDCICDYEGCDVEVLPEGTELTVGQALYMYANEKYDANTYYKVTGVIVEVSNDYYGNVYIANSADAEERLYVYGIYSAKGSVRYGDMPEAPAVGDVVTLSSKLATYNNAIQLSNAWLVHECEREFVCSACTICGEPKGGEDHTGGTATCENKAVCTVCGAEYGQLLAHAGGVATCQAKAVCATCGTAYGELAGHVWGEDGKCTTPGCTEEKPAEGTQPQTKTVTYNFSALTENGLELKNGAAAAVLNGADGGVQDIIASTTETKIYSGNGSGGILGSTDSKTQLIKFGTTSADGVLVIDFVDGVKVTKVEIKCHTFKANKETTLKVNEADAQNTALNAPATVLTFNIEAANEITITSTGSGNRNVVVFEIVVTYTVES